MTPHRLNLILCRTVDPRPLVDTVGNFPIPDPHSNSVLMLCQLGCGLPVWVGPKQQEHLDDPSCMVACLICGCLALKKEPVLLFQLTRNVTELRENIYGRKT